MTDQERQLLEELASRIQKAPAPQIDREADDLIRRSIGSRPDALYILTQTVLIQEMALNQAKQQVDELKRQRPPQSFLPNTPQPQSSERPAGSGFRSSSYQTGYAPPPAPAQAPPPLPQSQQPQYAQPEYAPQPEGGRFSGFLRNAAQTAAGVVAGEVAFSAISSLFGHHGGYSGGGGSSFFGGGAGISPASETIINNYYEDDRGREHERPETFNTSSDDSDRYADDTTDASDDSTDYSADDSTDDSADDVVDDDSSYDDGSDSIDV